MAEEEPLPEIEPFNPAKEKFEKASELQKMLESYKGVVQVDSDTTLFHVSDSLEPEKTKAYTYTKKVSQEDVDAAVEGAKIYIKNAQILLDELKAMEGI